MDVEQVGDRQGESGEHRVDDVQRERHEHERELEGLGDPGQERGQRRRRQDADRDLALLLVRHMDHRQRGGGQPEHQDRVEPRGEDACRRVACGEPGEFAGDGFAAGRLVVAVEEPDVRVRDVVQAERNQHAVGESVDEGAQRARAADELAEARQPRVEDRIEVAHREREEQARQRHHDRDEAPASEESEVGRQLDGVVAVEQPRGEQADHDAREHAVVDLGLVAGLVDLAGEHDRRHGLEHRLDHQVAHDGRQCGRTVGLPGESDGDADGEQQRQVGEHRVARGAHGLEERPDDRGLDSAQQVGLAQPEQDARRGQHRDRQHEALAQPLQLREARESANLTFACARFRFRRVTHSGHPPLPQTSPPPS